MGGPHRSAIGWSGIVVALGTAASGHAASLFFTHNSTAEHRVAELLPTGAPVTVYGQRADPFGVAIDASRGTVYWTDAGTDSIHRAPLDGSGPIEDLITDGLLDPHDVAANALAGKLYFADRRNDAIKRSDLDGSDVELLLDLTLPVYLEVDPVGKGLYFVYGASGPPLLGRANLDGTGLEVLVSSSSPLHGLALDQTNRKIYFGVRDGAEIHRVDFDSGNEEVFIDGLDAVPLDLAIDPARRDLYWSFYHGIRVAKLEDPLAATTLLSGLAGLSGLNGINGIALDVPQVPEPSSFSLLTFPILILAGWVRSLRR